MRFCPNRHGAYADQADVCSDCGERLVNDRRETELMPGLHILRLLGRGSGRTTLWEAQWTQTGQHVALKLCELEADLGDRRRMLQAAAMVAGLVHPNLAAVHAYGETASGDAYVVSDLLHGRSLLQLLEQKRSLPIGVAAHVTREVLGGLAALHGYGVVHRGVKPANIHLTPNHVGQPWEVKLMDFDHARRFTMGEVPPWIDLAHAQPGQSGAIIGTPEYMSPEQVIGIGTDPRTDLYAMGVVLQRLLTGEAPFADVDRKRIYEAQLRFPPRHFEMPDGFPPPAGLQQVLTRALAKQPADRFRTALEMQQALQSY